MGIQETMKVFMEDLVKNLVDNQNEIEVSVSISTKAILIQIKSSKTDTGKIIGRNGRTIEALKIIGLAVKNTKFPGDSKGVSVEILEDENSGYKDRNKNKI